MWVAVQAAEHAGDARRRRERRLRQMCKPALLKVVDAEKYSAPMKSKTEGPETHNTPR